MLKLVTVVMMIVLSVSPAVAASDSDEMSVEVRRLMELTGAANLGVDVVKTMIASFKQTTPDVPESFWTEFEKEIRPEEMIELVVPIYAKNLTLEEVKAANAFYSTPEGRSMVKKLPVIMTEAMQAGELWGRQIATRAIERLKSRESLPKDA